MNTVHVRVETHEGTLLYSDDAGQHERRALGSLTVALLHTDEGSTQSCWRTVGPMSVHVHALAELLAATPGLYEAVTGMYLLATRLREQQQKPSHPAGANPQLQLCSCGHFRLQHQRGEASCLWTTCPCTTFSGGPA